MNFYHVMRSSTQQTVQSPLIVHNTTELYHWPHVPDAFVIALTCVQAGQAWMESIRPRRMPAVQRPPDSWRLGHA